MAAAPVYNLYIYPYPLNNLSVTSSYGTHSITDMGSYYSAEVRDGEITVSADDYLTQTIVMDSDETITLVPSEVSKLSNGTNTYTIRDDKARSILTTKQDTISSSNKLSASLVSGLATVATSGSYNDLSNKPTIPTVNNATLTIQKNSTNVATFTANASSNVTANISVPTNTNELTNGAGFITLSALTGYATESYVTTATANMQTTGNLVTSISSTSTDAQYPSAKCVYDIVGDIETALRTINSGGG